MMHDCFVVFVSSVGWEPLTIFRCQAQSMSKFVLYNNICQVQYCPKVERLIVCVLVDLTDLTAMPVAMDFNSPRLTAAIRLAGSTSRYHLAVADASLRPEMRCVYPSATAMWYGQVVSSTAVSACRGLCGSPPPRPR